MPKPESNVEQYIASPCTRNCCLNQQDVCLGCYRHISEITAWHDQSAKDRLIVLARCEQRKSGAEK